MKKLLLLLALCMPFAYGAQKAPTRDFTILLDYRQSEEKQRTDNSTFIHGSSVGWNLGALTSSVLPALYQQAAPLLVSKSLLRSVMARKAIFEDCQTLSASQLGRKYSSYRITRAPSLAQFKSHCMYAKKMYESIQKELTGIFKQGTKKEIETALEALTSKRSYLEQSAPRSLQIYTANRTSMGQAMHRELQAYALCYYAPLSSDTFIMKDISQELALLVPRSYYSDLKNAPYMPNNKAITPLEKQAGLKLNHLKDIADSREFLKDLPITPSIPLTRHLSDILVTTKEGSKHIWAIYMAGHGLPDFPEREKVVQLKKLKALYEKEVAQEQSSRKKHTLSRQLSQVAQELSKAENSLKCRPQGYERIICSIAADEFTKMLIFFEKEISTALFFYGSCYGGGQHTVTPYKQGAKDLVFSYDIINGSISDALSYQDEPTISIPPYQATARGEDTIVRGITRSSFDPRKKKLIPRTTVRFDTFASLLRKPLRDVFALAQALQPYVTPQGKINNRYLENIALIRPSGKTTFSVAGNNEGLLTLSKAGGTPSEKVSVAFLDQEAYGTLDLSKGLPTILSLSPGTAFHVINTLSAPAYQMRTIAQSFLEIPSLSSSKLFWIKKLECKKDSSFTDILPFDFFRGDKSKHTTLHNVIVIRNIQTTDGLKHTVTTGIYFSDTQGTTWFIPIQNGLGSATRVNKVRVHKELYALFNGLQKATLS